MASIDDLLNKDSDSLVAANDPIAGLLSRNSDSIGDSEENETPNVTPAKPSPAQDDDDEDESDSVKSSSSAPLSDDQERQALGLSSKSSPDPSSYLVTKQDLEDAQNKKRSLAMLAGLANAFGNMKSAGSIVMGRGNTDYTKAFQPMIDQADQNIKNKEVLQAQALKAPELQYVAKAQDPNSDVSKAAAANHKALLLGMSKYFPEMKDQLTAAANKMGGMSAFDQNQLLDKTGLSKIASADMLGGMKTNQMMLALMNRKENQDRNFGLKSDNQANQVAQQFDNDSLMKQYSGQLGQINKAKSLLSTQGPITHQTASELSQDLATILNNGRAAGLEASNKQEYDSASGLLAQVQQWATAHPQDALPEDFRKQLNDQFDRLNQGVLTARSTRAHTLAQGRNFANNPSAQNTMNAKVNEYDAPSGGGLVNSAQAGQGSDKASAALQEAQQVLADPKSPPDQVAKAIKVWQKAKQEGVIH